MELAPTELINLRLSARGITDKPALQGSAPGGEDPSAALKGHRDAYFDGDFVNVPRGHVHCFTNTGDATARMILTFTPAGSERFFEETREEAPNRPDPADVPDNVAEVAARYVEAAPRHGLEFVEA